MSTFHFSSAEAPTKKKVNNKSLDKAVTAFINSDSAFEIEIETGGKQPTVVKFTSFITPVLLKAFYDIVRESCVVTENAHKVAVIDEGLLALTTHWFVIDRLSDMPVPTLDDTLVDSDRIAAYGTYFSHVSFEYRNIIDTLYVSGLKVCEGFLEQFNAVASNFDVNEFLADPEIIGTVKDMLRNADIH